MITIQLSKHEKIKHLVIWCSITIFYLIFDPWKGSFLLQIILTGLVMSSYVFAYYSFLLFIFPRFYNISTIKLILSSLVTFILFLLFDYFNYYHVPGMFGESSLFDNIPVYSLGLQYIIFFFIILIMALGAFQNRVNLKNLEHQNEKEMILLIKNLGFFKNQFNSHITFNFLNYCYSHIHKSSIEGAEAIELFSNMLRHSLGNKVDKPILLIKEIEYISDYIALHRQLNKDIQVDFHVEGNFKNQYILPYILIIFIENAFKHGEIYSVENPVTIRLETFVNSIKLNVNNKKKLIKGMITSIGIGHSNVRQQLELFYKGRYELYINEEGENYSCELSINTKNHKYA